MNQQPKIGHRSFSALTSWVRCGKAFQLEREVMAPSEPAWWFVGGSAFHAAAEKYLISLITPPEEELPF